MSDFVARMEEIGNNVRSRSDLKILQVNMGNLCNQQCAHCHVNAGPKGEEIMTRETVDGILRFLRKDRNLILDITGGAPEMNPNFEYLVSSAEAIVKEVIVRSNLTVIFEPGKEHLPLFFKEHGVHLICSLPCYSKENVDEQRGLGVFEKSIKALRQLNEQGYGLDSGLKIDIVYNPGGPFLPPPQDELEKEYKKKLKEENDIEFNKLMTITNMPINRFKVMLEENDEYDRYMQLLEENFNECVVGSIMCRTLLSVGWDGRLYDCDFNQAMCMELTDEKGDSLKMKDLNPDELTDKEILFGDHCFSCTAGSGSSCQGSLEGDGEQSSDNNCSSDTKEEDQIDKTRDMVTKYYGEVLKSGKDLKTSACCNIESVPGHIKAILPLIEPEIIEKFYGCGSPVPLLLKGMSVLDLGCGTGKDVYMISKLAGEKGKVVGVDMTQKQLDVASKYVDKQMENFGFNTPNVEFFKGYIEDLKSIGLSENSFDVAVSNCVVNLSPRKDQVLSEVFRVLKEGGEFYFSDVFSDRRLPEWAKKDPVLVGECLGGALYWKDFVRMAAEAGFHDARLYSKKKISFSNEDIEKKIGFVNFYSITYRLFKIGSLEAACEDYGQTAEYTGGIEYSPDEYRFDDHQVFEKAKPVHVCGNTAEVFKKSRFSKYFKVTGDMNEHLGQFPGCGADPFVESTDDCSGTSGCC